MNLFVIGAVVSIAVSNSPVINDGPGRWKPRPPPTSGKQVAPPASPAQTLDVVFRPVDCEYTVTTGAGAMIKETVKSPTNNLKRAICVPREPVVLVVVPERLPPSRLRLSLESARGEHVTAEWDPLTSDRLAHKVVLSPGLWWISFRSDAIRHSSRTAQDLSWQDNGDGLQPAATVGLGYTLDRKLFQSEATRLDPAAQGQQTAARATVEYKLISDNLLPQQKDPDAKIAQDVYVTLSIERLPSVTRSLEVLMAREGGSLGGQSISAAGRSGAFDVGTASEAASQLAAIIAEVIVDRAKNQSLKAAQGAIAADLGCSGTPAWSGKAPWLRLTRICSTLTTTSLDSLAAGLDTLRRAAEADLLESLGRLLAERSAKVPDRLRRAYDLAATHLPAQVASALERGTIEPHAGQAAMARLAGAVLESWVPDPNAPQAKYPLSQAHLESEELAAAAVGLVFAAASQCFANETCDARHLSHMLANPDRYFHFGDHPEMVPVLVKYVEAWPDALRTAQTIVSVMRNGPAVKPPEALTGAIEVAMEMQLVHTCLRPKDEEHFPEPSEFSACLRSPTVDPVRTWRRALVAAVNRDGPAAISALLEALKNEAPDEVKSSRFWRAAAAGAGAWTGTSAGDAEAKKTATKAAINAAIDILTDHHERETWVVSFSAALRFVAGGQTGSSGPYFAGPSVPIGLTLEVPRFTGARWLGFHADISVFDLGRLLQAGAVEVANDAPTVNPTRLIWPQVSAGLLFAGGWVFVGGMVGFQPLANQWSFGGSVGLQVPLIDFN